MTKTALIGMAALVILSLLGAVSSDLLVHWLWFESLELGSVFRAQLLARWLPFIVSALLAFTWLYGNWMFADRQPGGGLELRFLRLPGFHAGRKRRVAKLRFGAPALVLSSLGALIAGLVAHQQWRTWLLAFYGVPYDRSDPIFQRDLSFFLFHLPAEELLQTSLSLLVAVAFGGASAIYLLKGSIRLRGIRLDLQPTARVHLSLLASGFFVVWAWSYHLQRFGLLYSPGGVIFGATHTDANITMVALQVLVFISLGMAAAWVLTAASGRLAPPVFGLALLATASLLGQVVVPGLYQRYWVAPNESSREEAYIAHHIEMTREAYGLSDVEVRNFAPQERVDWSDIEPQAEMLANVRLWDWRPLLTAYQQLQEIRQYYQFVDVDVGRYALKPATGEISKTADGAPGARPQQTQVMLAAREINLERLPAEAQRWENRWLVYTHGYGLAMSPVAALQPNGMPTFTVRDLPPVSTTDLSIERPEIYFGELTTTPIIVGTTEQEFDYPRRDGNAYNSYAGADGMGVGGRLRRLLFAWHYGEWSIMLSDYLTADSRLLAHRSVQDRIQTLAPFLQLDADPYLALVGGRLLWIQDAYTTSDRFPYSLPWGSPNTAPTGLGERFNYIRNSVKATVDAYDGTVNLYAIDTDDPVLNTYRAVFADLFNASEQIPQPLRDHLRYPKDLFRIQAEIYSTYHMDEPRQFYNREDMWQTPNELYAGSALPMEPYYILASLPPATDMGGSRSTADSTAANTDAAASGGRDAMSQTSDLRTSSLEYILMLPLTPANRQNLIAWMAARSDSPRYGELVLYRFPKDRLIYGPMQIEARIDQDPTISQQLSLWDQRGSSVIRGNLLVIPVGSSILYVEPVFLRADQSDLPELRRVIVANGQRVVMEPDLASALAAAFPEASKDWVAALARRTSGFQANLAATRSLGSVPGVETPTLAGVDDPLLAAVPTALGAEALATYRIAQERLRAGDWVGFGTAMQELELLLERLSRATSGTDDDRPSLDGMG